MIENTIQRGVGLIRIDSPPVNALSAELVAGLSDAFDAAASAPEAMAIVICCAGRTFVAGADINWFDRPDFSAAPLNALLARIEACGKPVIASLHGTVLGGGLELAMACHHRVCQPETRLGMPEINLGLIPGSLGTQRLPRLVGLPTALDMISTGRPIDAKRALAAGLADAVTEGDVAEVGIAAALAGVALRRASALPVAPFESGVLAAFMDEAARKPERPALGAVGRCLRAAAELSFADGEAVEAAEFAALVRSPTSLALRHLFFAEREAGKIPGIDTHTPARRVDRVGILGAGTMGGGIAMCFVNAGIPVTLVDATAEGLARGLDRVRRNYEATAARGRMTTEQVEQRMGRISGGTQDTALAECDLVIEAVFEDLALKQRVCARLGAITKPGTIIATNTSTLDVDLLAQASGRSADVVGMHFFSPANVMRLLEVVRGAATAPDVLWTAMTLAKRIGKVAVASGVCYGFIGNRMAEVYCREADFLLMEGAEPRSVDASVEELGMAMGPCRMLDMAGVDVAAGTVIERGKAGGLPPDPSYRAVVRALLEQGRLGQKTGGGYYDYQGRTPVPAPELERTAAGLADGHGIARRDDIGRDEMVERLLYPLINEGLRILDEGISYRPGDIDVVWTAGYGFPVHRGGPMFMADQIGLRQIAARLAHYAAICGDPFGYWTPSPLLTRLAQANETISDWAARRSSPEKTHA